MPLSPRSMLPVALLLAMSGFVALAALDINDFVGGYTVNTPETIAYLRRQAEEPGNSARQRKLYGLMIQKTTDDTPSEAIYSVSATDLVVQNQGRTERHVFGDITAGEKEVAVAVTLKQGDIQHQARLVFSFLSKNTVLLRNFELDVDVPLVLTRKTK